MWCPKCQKYAICAAVPLLPDTERLGQRQNIKTRPEIHWFERRRKCQVCGEEFDTAEINKNLLVEFWHLRDALRKISDDAGTIKEKADALIRWQQ